MVPNSRSPTFRTPESQAAIEKIQFGGLDQALSQIPMPRLQQNNQIARLENGNLTFRRVVRNAAIRCQRRQIQHLTGTCGAHAHETLKIRQITHVDELA